MAFPNLILSIAATVAVAIFSLMFIYLVAKWSLKRTREMAKRFELEEKQLQQMDTRKIEIDKRISEFKQKYNEAMNKEDTKMANFFLDEMKKLEKEKKGLYKN